MALVHGPRARLARSPGCWPPLGAAASIVPPPGAPRTGLPGPDVYDARPARRVPAVARATAAYGGHGEADAHGRLPGHRAGAAPAPDPWPGPTPIGRRPWFVQSVDRGLPPQRERHPYVTAGAPTGGPRQRPGCRPS